MSPVQPELSAPPAGWNETVRDYPRSATIGQLFSAQAARTPQAVAVIYPDEPTPAGQYQAVTQLTYGELERRSSQLAAYLRQQGVGPETLVGVYMERSPGLMVSLLGIFKAGGAYVPLDPAFPLDRLALMVEDSGAPLILTQERLLSRLPGLDPDRSRRVLCIDRDWPLIEQATASEGPVSTADNLAYVIYTSGSTGRPKGVAISQRAAVNFLMSMAHEPGLTAADTLLAITTLSFDISVLELFLPLVVGAKTVILTREAAADARRLQAHLLAAQPTVMQATPATWRMLLESDWPGDPQLKVLCGGEAMPRDLADQLLARSRSLWNMYGPTETTVWSTIHQVEPGDQAVPVGRPIANTTLYVLDEQLQPVPIGVQGELFIGGDGLARGYLNRPDLTAEKFIAHPFSDTPGARLYRTGDLASYRPDGSLDFFGRLDHQVKIRGFRIELGEIESVLRTYPEVQEAVVVAREDGGHKRLVAYLKSQRSTELAGPALRDFLKEKLPDYMIPALFVTLPQLPLTPNGKINRRALPAPPAPSPAGEVTPPTTPLQEKLVTIWAEVLGRSAVGIDEDLFELGGDSLLATRIISRVRRAFDIDLPLLALFEAPTVSGLAQAITAADTAAGPVIQPRHHPEPAPLSTAQQRFWYLDQLSPGSPAFNMAEGYHLSGYIDVEALERSLNDLVQRHESFRTTFSLIDGKPVQQIAPALTISLPQVDLSYQDSQSQAETLQQLYQTEAHYAFNLTKGPLVRFLLVKLESREHVLFVVMHHIISDAWSMGVFYRELSALYNWITTGGSLSLAEPALRYADFAVWQQSQLTTPALRQQLSYWQAKLKDAPRVLELPADYRRPAVQQFNGGQVQLQLSPQLTEQLQALGRRQGVTLYMTLLAVFKALLYRYTGQTNIVVGTPIAARNQIELEEVIGIFVNNLVLYSQINGEAPFVELLRQVQQLTAEAYAHQDLPFEYLLKALQPERDPSRNPLFQIYFNMLNLEDQGPALAGIEARRFAAETTFALMDLTLYTEVRQGRLIFKAVYNADLFKPESMRHLLAHYETMLAGIVADPQCAIDDLPLLTALERQQFLHSWQGRTVEFPQNEGIHRLIEAQAGRAPAAPAVAFLDQELTYAELDERANRLAHYLIERGVGPEVLVGLCVQRSLDMVIGILGILKAGGAYVPLDPSYPPERIAYMIEDAGLGLILTQAELVGGLSGKADLLCLDRDWSQIAAGSAQQPAVAVTGDTLAYVIYTSGSTGRPKGVMITHRNLCHFVNAVRESLGIAADDVYLQTGSITYALSVRQLMTPLTHGAKVVISSQEEITNPIRLFELIKRQGVTRTDFVPSQWRAFLQVLARLDAHKRVDLLDNRLSHIVSIGEPLLSDLPQTWRETFNHPAQLTNIYGQTETTGVVAHYPIPSTSVGDEIQVVPIGWAVPNTQLLILDKRLQPTPVGVPGELFVASPGLARGYLNRPDLDAEKFLPHPFSDEPQARLYRTGDYARFRPDGAIEFMGRKDHQIKIRGMRVELGEIEAALRSRLPVKEVVVTTVGLAADEKQIVAYLVGEMAESLTPEELRSYLTETLPGHMIPSKFIFMEALPRNPNGKIDRNALPPVGVEPATVPALTQDRLFYIPSWQRSIPPDLMPTFRPASESEQWLIFVDSSGVGTTLTQRLELRGQSVVTVGPGLSLTRRSESHFELNPSRVEDYHALLAQLVAEDRFPRRVLYLWNVTGREMELSIETAQTFSFYALIYLAQALHSQPNTSAVAIGVVTDSLHSVFGHEVVSPEKALLLGPARVISQEMGNLSCRPIDIEIPAEPNPQKLAMIADQLISELYVEIARETVAYRGRHRWTQTLEPIVTEPNQSSQPPLLRRNGVYLITGGLGGIGLALASYLVRQVNARLVLTSRSVIPERERWPDLVRENGPLAEKFRQLQALEALGADLLLLKADVTDQDQMEHVVEQTLAHFGDLNGVIHAAGVRGVFGPIQEKSVATAAPVLAPKVIGADVLKRVLATSDIDFIIYCSSLAGVTGRFWQADYCAANAFLDALAQSAVEDKSVVVSIDFDIWREVEVPIRSDLPEAFETLLNQSRQEGLSTAEGLAAFDLVFNRPLPQLIVTHQPLRSPAVGLEEARKKAKISPERVRIEEEIARPSNDIEAKVIKIWQELFHTDRLSIHDDFFELGGHSLLLIRMLAQIEQVFGVALAPTALFAGATIEKLAKKIAEGPATSGLTSLVPVQPAGSNPPFFCVHGATGDVLWFRELAKYLGPEQPFYGLQSVGLDGLREPLESVEGMAAHYLREIRTIQPEGPYYLGGYCFGGQIVYEMAQQLKEQGQAVALLALLSSEPYNTGFNVPHSHTEYCIGLVRSAPGWGERLSELSKAQFLKRAQRKVRRYLKEHLGRGVVEVADVLDEADQLPDFQRRVIEQNMVALDNYHFKPYQGHIHVFQAKAPSLLTVEVPGHGWDRLAQAGITTIMVPGSHQSILREPRVATLAEELARVLAQARQLEGIDRVSI